MQSSHHVVIIGGGFGGLYAAQSLKRSPVRVTLLDRRNFHLFQPLLYQVATGALSPANIAVPLRAILKRQANAQVLLAEAAGIRPDERRVLLDHGDMAYDSLIIATGTQNNYFGNAPWEPLAPGLKTIEDAIDIRRRVLLAFENAERETDAEQIRKWLTFVVIGAGATGVELAGALAEIARQTLRREFRSINPARARILLIDRSDRVLPPYPPSLSEKAERSLLRLGVSTFLNTSVREIRRDGVIIERNGVDESIGTRTVLWAAGVRTTQMSCLVQQATGAALDGIGRVVVERDLSIAGYPEIFVIGDLALFTHQSGEALPGIAPVAMQQGRYVARLIEARLAGRVLPEFCYRHRGTMATIGRAAAVAHVGRYNFSGYFAWLVWLFVHLIFIMEFENRVLVLLQWAWNYVTHSRPARLITGGNSRTPGD